MKFIKIDATEKLNSLNERQNKTTIKYFQQFNSHNILLGKYLIETPKIPFIEYEDYKIDDNQFRAAFPEAQKGMERLIFDSEKKFITRILSVEETAVPHIPWH
jgi:hypothetical protein